MAITIGINAYHPDSAACLLKDGSIVAAAEEERFRRIKHWAGFPSESIRYCLAEGNLSLSDVDVIAINQNNKANLKRKILYGLSNRPQPRLILNRLMTRRKRVSIEVELMKYFPNEYFSGKIHHIEHHLAHLASSFYLSPFKEAVILSIDGFGDFASGGWGIGNGSGINIDKRIYFPHSLGIFYQALTQYLGFWNYGDEYKLMGLAAYGKPIYKKEIFDIIQLNEDGSYRLNLKYFLHHKKKIAQKWKNSQPKFNALFSPYLEKKLGKSREFASDIQQKHKDLAASIQHVYEQTLFHTLNKIYSDYQLPKLAIAGGCALNSVANGKIAQFTSFDELYIPAAPGDAGGAIGAALLASQNNEKAKLSCRTESAYLGPSYGDNYINVLLKKYDRELKALSCKTTYLDDENSLCDLVAKIIAEGNIVGWFQGRMEWGARALGNRSILGDPRRADMRERLNVKIKRRESFRPFAPSILSHKVKDWFDKSDSVPYMSQVFAIKHENRNKIPAVTHVDGTGRLQTVKEADNSRYFRLIKAFWKQTEIPMIVNTSFNENEPIVNKPEEALDCFLRTKMDVLVLGNWVVQRKSSNEKDHLY